MSNTDLPQLMLQSAARQFIYDLQNAGYREAASFLELKYMTTANEGARISLNSTPIAIKDELITG